MVVDGNALHSCLVTQKYPGSSNSRHFFQFFSVGLSRCPQILYTFFFCLFVLGVILCDMPTDGVINTFFLSVCPVVRRGFYFLTDPGSKDT